MPNPEVRITNGLHHHGTLPVTILVHASERLRAVAPLPVAAVKGAHATGHPALSIARQNSLQFFRVGRRKYEGPNSSTIKRINSRTDIEIVEADSRTYSSVLSGASPYAMTRKAATTFCKGWAWSRPVALMRCAKKGRSFTALYIRRNTLRGTRNRRSKSPSL